MPSRTKPEIAKIRLAFGRCLGTWPSRPADPGLSIVRRETSGGVQRLLLEYAVEPGERIRAWLTAPSSATLSSRARRLPALLCPHPHGGQYPLGKDFTMGSRRVPKSIRRDAAYAVRFARLGYVCLTPDMLAFGERIRRSNDGARGVWLERVEAMRQLMLGRCKLTKDIHDLRVSLDVLRSFPAVDCARIGAVGFSMGSGLSWYTAMVEPRIKAVVGVCSFYTYRLLSSPALVHCYMNYVPGVLDRELETFDLFGLIAPRPFLMLTGAQDKGTPVAETRRLYRNARHWWADHPSRFHLSIHRCGHHFTDAMYREAADFLQQHLGAHLPPSM